MQYSVIHIQSSFAEEWQKDLFDQQLCDLGIDTIDGEDYYIPSGLWLQNQTAITDYLSTYGFPFFASDVPDENWNAVWEEEHPMEELPMGVKIVPHCAFGAGHHETTAMMINALMANDLSGKNVLDNGCGTGVLGIFAKKKGASRVLAIDIDDKSVSNTLENAALNNVQIDTRLGELKALSGSEKPETGSWDLILANIHRNILLAQMSQYARLLSRGGQLWLSGFYETDCPALVTAAEEQGLRHIATNANGEWRMLVFVNKTL